MQQTYIETEARPRNWLPLVNALFYLVLAVGVAAFGYYLYTYLNLINIYLSFLLQAAGLTIGISVFSMILAMIFGFIGALGRI